MVLVGATVTGGQSLQDLKDEALSHTVHVPYWELIAVIKQVLWDVQQADQYLTHRFLADVSDHVIQYLRVTVDIAKNFLWLRTNQHLEELAEVAWQDWV